MRVIKELPSFEEYKTIVSDILVKESGSCPVMPVIEMLQGKWKLQLIYWLIIKSPMRFGYRRKALHGITNTMLTNVLRELEQDGFVIRTQFNEIPPHVEYSLTEKGQDLLPVIYAITAWGMKYIP